MSEKEKPAEGGGIGKAAGVVLLITIVVFIGLISMFAREANYLLQVIRQNQGVLLGIAAAFLIFKAMQPKKPEGKKEEKPH